MMKKKEYCSLGIMSGTSLDGLDFSLVTTDGVSNIKNIFNEYYKFNNNFKISIKTLIKKFRSLDYNLVLNSKEFLYLNRKFTELTIKKIKTFLIKNSISIDSIDVIGLHGNTMIHQPNNGLSIQLGDPRLISNRLKVKVISNFRDNDIKSNGQGAPLVPIFHKCKFSESNKRVMIVNIGGISNFSFLIGKKIVMASDIGPGNKLIDELCSLTWQNDFDLDGKKASKGEVIPELIRRWQKKLFNRDKFPISYDNSFFKLQEFIKKVDFERNFNNFDLLRSLTYFSALIIYNAQKKIKNDVDKWIFCGGGVSNKTLMKDLEDFFGSDKISVTQDYGLDPFFVESEAFAFISVRTLRNLPSSFPQTTGCSKSSVSGKIYKVI